MLPFIETPGATLPSVPTAVPELRVGSVPDQNVPVAGFVASGPQVLTGTADPDFLEVLQVSGKAGEVHRLPGGGWIAGVGGADVAGDTAHLAWRTAGAALLRKIYSVDDAPAEVQLLLPAGISATHLQALVIGALLGGYEFKVTAQEREPRVERIQLIAPAGTDPVILQPDVQRAAELARASALARDLANTPSNIKSPAWLADTAAALAAEIPQLSAVVRDEQWLTEQGFGGVLAVGAGSSRPPRFLEMHWQPTVAPGTPHVVLVGKGITFDTGGISIKPADGMHLMRTDMSGGAAVIAALLAIARLRIPVQVTGLVPCAENHVSGTAYRPGDVVRHYGGITTEVVNTDAEGRMVLADALAYAVDRLEPDLLVDVATLTGAMKVALGLRTAGLFASETALATRIVDAGARVGEALWQMPLLPEVQESVGGTVGDVVQSASGPGGIFAAQFLRTFTGDLPWAHLDIAGPARADKVYAEIVPGGTGFSARTLVELVRSFS
ncbi:leucyl aminopeptidase family protein [Pseudonocardiaceae bacterium YIM PH 21723]|nr:leucyl aminopeptidase family protein [Pseudonocardiaceae bacterium YIM PH 21723]